MGPRAFRRRDVLKLFGSATTVTILVAACGGGGNAPAPGATSAPQAAAPTQAPAQAAPTTAPQAPAATPTAAAQQAAAATPTTAAQQAGAPTPTPNPLASVPIKSGKKVVEWWWPWGGMTGLNALAALAKDFNTTHDDYQVKALQIETWGGGAKLLSAIAAGTPPAVETGGTFYDFWMAGGAQPLDDYIKKSKVINPADMFDTLVNAAKFKGKTYGVPAIEDFLRWELCANQDLLQQHKFNPQELPQTWDDLYAWAKEITQVDSNGAIKVMGFDPLDAEGAVWGGDAFYWTAALDFKYYDETKSQYLLNSDPIKESMNWIMKYVDIVGADKLAGFAKAYGTWTESPTAMFPTGIEGLNINGYWAPGELVKSAPGRKFSYSWVPVPSSRKGAKIVCEGGHFSILPKGSPSPEEGFAVIEYLNTPKAYDIIYEVTGWFGPSKSYLDKYDISKYPGLDFYVRAAKEATVHWGPFFEPLPSFASDQFYKLLDEVIYHKTSVSDAATKLQSAVDAEMKNRFPSGV